MADADYAAQWGTITIGARAMGNEHSARTEYAQYIEFWRWPRFSDDPAVILAQYAALKRQIPLLYAVLIITASAIVLLYRNHAPDAVLTITSGVFIVISTARMVHWLRVKPAADAITVEDARITLKRTTLAVVPIAVAYLGYAFFLDQFGGPFEQAAIAVCVVLTAIGCIFCLIHLPQAARLVHLLIMVPYVLFHLSQGNAAFVLIAFNAAIVTTLMIRVSQNVFEGFVELVTSQTQLALQQKETARLAAENRAIAMTDALTGMPNRRVFLERMESAIAENRDAGTSFFVGIVDLDRFKPVNDIYGHGVGDQLLVEVGARLSSLDHESLVVARLGGDEFGIIAPGCEAEASALGETILKELARPFAIGDNTFAIGCSIGFTTFPHGGTSAADLFHHADYALYNVKSNGRGGTCLFSYALAKQLLAKAEMETQLQIADLDSELSIHFQPIISLSSGAVCGWEALGRWESAKLGKVVPAEFIEAAERLNIMGTITLSLFDKLLQDIKLLPAHQTISFNLSAHDIVTSATVDALVAAIDESGLAKGRFVFEITETALMRDFAAATRNIHRLRRHGVSIALDDFGTGFSSLGYLNRLPIDKIKIDRSFVQDLDEAGGTRNRQAILEMCRALDLECIIEGIETERQGSILAGLGCRFAQGFLYAAPMTIEQVPAWMPGTQAAAPNSPVALRSIGAL